MPRRRMFLPAQFREGHALAYAAHDVMLHLLVAGEKHQSFGHIVRPDPGEVFPNVHGGQDIFDWLAATNRNSDRAAILRSTVFPAILSDFLHFVYEALSCTRKAKLIVAYALLRKPIQDNLGLLEMIAINLEGFATSMVADPSKLDPKKAGGIDAHTKRIEKVLELLEAGDRFDAAFLATIRYDKTADDSFAASFDKALHLFTGHEAIRTEPLNINFVFSGPEAWMTQWAYLYSRLPYILLYAAELVEHVFSTFENRTDPAYLADIQRRLDAAVVLWGHAIEDPYTALEIGRLVQHSHSRLAEQFDVRGFGKPSRRDVDRMAQSGRFPRRWLRL